MLSIFSLENKIHRPLPEWKGNRERFNMPVKLHGSKVYAFYY
jgi:hypothetical protein